MGRDCWLHGYVCGAGFLPIPTHVGGRDTRDQVSRGKLKVIEYLDAECSSRVEQRKLRNLSQGERDGKHSDYVGHHLGGIVMPLPITP